MAPTLIYETDDPAFADRALASFEDKKIPAYTVDSGVASSAPTRGAKIGIFIERADDYSLANKILIELGAVADVPDAVAAYEIRVILVAAAAIAIIIGVAAALTQ